MNGKMLEVYTNSPKPILFYRVVPRGRLVASPTKAFAETYPPNSKFQFILSPRPAHNLYIVIFMSTLFSYVIFTIGNK